MLTIRIVRERDGKPMANARVSAYYGMLGQNSRDGRTDSQGEVHLELQPGEYTVTVNGGNNFSVKQKLHPGRNVIYVD